MFKTIKNDLPASIVVFFVALPLCLGIALASGAPLFSGLIAGIVGGIVVGSISGSKIGVSGLDHSSGKGEGPKNQWSFFRRFAQFYQDKWNGKSDE